MRPVKYHYADSFMCTYVISVFAAMVAETGEFLKLL
jgi:solute carrier family 25 uncoupling protein 27